jgi:hypothetical protein
MAQLNVSQARPSSGSPSRARELAERVNELFVGPYADPFHAGLLVFAWGLWLALSDPTFPTSASYRVMAELASEEVWGCTSAVAGFGLMVGAWRYDRWLVTLASLPAGLSFLLVGLSVVASNQVAPTAPLYLLVSMRCLALSKEFSHPRAAHPPYCPGPRHRSTPR